VHRAWNERHRSLIPCVRPTLAWYVTERAWGKERRRWGANRHRIAAEDGHIEVFAVSNGGGDSTMVVVSLGEVWRMADGGGKRCGVERSVL
jgi:hypothetical protein